MTNPNLPFLASYKVKEWVEQFELACDANKIAEHRRADLAIQSMHDLYTEILRARYQKNTDWWNWATFRQFLLDMDYFLDRILTFKKASPDEHDEETKRRYESLYRGLVGFTTHRGAFMASTKIDLLQPYVKALSNPELVAIAERELMNPASTVVDAIVRTGVHLTHVILPRENKN